MSKKKNDLYKKTILPVIFLGVVGLVALPIFSVSTNGLKVYCKQPPCPENSKMIEKMSLIHYFELRNQFKSHPRIKIRLEVLYGK